MLENQIDSIFPFSTLITYLVSLFLPASLWLKEQLWSYGNLWWLQKNRPHLHSTPSSFSLRLQVEQRSLFTSFFSSSALSSSLMSLKLSGYLLLFSYFLGVSTAWCLNVKKFTFWSTVSTCWRRPQIRRSACSSRRADVLLRWWPSSLQCSYYSIITNEIQFELYTASQKTQGCKKHFHLKKSKSKKKGQSLKEKKS